jgi:plastocyanin
MLVAVLAGVVGVVAVSAYADHPQVTISLMPASEAECTGEVLCISPSEVTVDAGGEVIWSNDGTEDISISDGMDHSVIDSGTLQPGQTYQIKFEEAGEYRFSSESHPWITGIITVVGHGGHDDAMTGSHGTIESGVPLGVQIETMVDDQGGVDVKINTDGWRWAPENVNGKSAPGEGHAHLYVDGAKIGRAYGPYQYVNPLEPGSHQIRVTLNDNGHDDLTSNGFPMEASVIVLIPERDRMDVQEPAPVTGTAEMSVDAVAHEDAVGGYNLQLVLTGFELSGHNVGGSHVQGEGYAKVFVDDEYLARLYELWHKMPALEPGMHTITVALFSNNHAPYYWDGEPVEATVTVHAPERDDSSGHGH